MDVEITAEKGKDQAGLVYISHASFLFWFSSFGLFHAVGFEALASWVLVWMSDTRGMVWKRKGAEQDGLVRRDRGTVVVLLSAIDTRGP